MWIGSWNAKHGSDMELSITNQAGEKLGYTIEIEGEDSLGEEVFKKYEDGYNDDLFFPYPLDKLDRDDWHQPEGCSGYWISSSHGSSNLCLWAALSWRSLQGCQFGDINEFIGLRPVVCLRENVRLVIDGTKQVEGKTLWSIRALDG